MKNKLAVVRGGGDLATGIIYILKHFVYDVIITETQNPSAIRRTVSLCEAIYEDEYTVEDITAVLCKSVSDIPSILNQDKIPLLIDPKCEMIKELKPDIVVDAILAKKNLGTTTDMAKIVIGIGPGFCAGKDVHAAVETSRGHNLARVIFSGTASKNTGVPGIIAGYGIERVIHSPCAGIIKNIAKIGDSVDKNEIIAYVNEVPVKAKIAGTLRGLIRDGYKVKNGFKIADVDPRDVSEYCNSISDKSRMIGFGTLFAINKLSGKEN